MNPNSFLKMAKKGKGGRRNQRPDRAQSTPVVASSSPEELTGITLPDEIILEILCRTPVKVLIRFRCVSKSWLALTVDPRFIYMHLNRNASTNKRILFHGFATNLSATIMSLLHINEPLVTLFELKLHQPYKLDYPRKFNFCNFVNEMVFCGSVNGIVCLSHSQNPDTGHFVQWGRFAVLWNPSMNRCKPILLPARKSIFDISPLVSVGLGFDADANDFKIIRIVPVALPPPPERNCMSRVEIYSAKRDSWKDVNNGALIPFYPGLPNCNFIIKGVPYWACGDRDKDFLGAIDPCTGMYRKVPYPKYVKNQRTSMHPVNLMDSIAVLIYSPGTGLNHLVDVYVLDESCGHWMKKYTTQPIVSEGLRMPQCLTTGELVVETWEGANLYFRSTFFYDPSTGCLSTEFDASGPLWSESYSHVESLVCLKGMEPLEKEAKEDKNNKKPKKKIWDKFMSEGFELVLRISEV